MKNLQKVKSLPVGLVIGSLLLVIIGYNYWSYLCGYCTLSSLLSLSTPAVLLILSNVVAGAALLYVKNRNRQQQIDQSCRCGAALRGTWSFCPACGAARHGKAV